MANESNMAWKLKKKEKQLENKVESLNKEKKINFDVCRPMI